jgi:hypothetical protein
MLSTIRLQLAGPGGSALAGLPSSAPVLVSCVDADGELPDISKFASVNDQQILMQVPVGRWSCSISEIQGFHRRKMPDNSVFTRAGETTDYPITLEAQQYSVTLVLQDQNGASITIPESPSEAYARCVGSEEDLSKTLLPGASSVSFQVVGSDTYKCSVRNVAGYIDASLAITVGSQGASSHDVILPTSEELLTLSVSKANQEGAYTSLQPISLSARSLAAQQLVTRVNLLSGFSASVVPLSAPGLVCAEAEIQGEATSIYRGTVSSGQHQTASIEVLPPDSTLFVKLVDNSGHQIPISGTIRAIVEAESDNFSYRNTLGFTAGSAMANVRGGATYRVTLLPPAEGEHFYFQNRTFGLSTPSISLAVQPSQINEVSFELAEETEIVTINGTASGGFLTFFHGSSFGSVARNIEVVKPLTQVKVPPGDHSLVYRGGTSALPQLIPFSVGSGKVNEITLKTYKADTLVSIAPRFVSSFRGTTSCNAFSDDGVVLLPKSSNRPDQTIQLALSTSSTDWTIDCSAWSFDNQKRYHGRSAHLVDPSSTEPIAINLHEVGTVEQATASSDTSEQLAVTAGAGVSVFAPRFTFGHANVVTLALDSRVHAPSSQSVAPVKAFRLTARGPQDEPLTPIKSLMMELTLEEDMAVYGYSDLLGYVPLRRQRAQLEIAPVGQLGLHSFAIPPDLVNNGLVVITKEGSDGGAKDTPEIGPSPDPNRDLPRPSQVSLRPPGKVWLRSKRMGRSPTRWTLRARWSATTGPADCYRVVIIGRKGRFKRAYRVPIKAARTKSFQKLRPGRYLVKVQSISNRRGSAYASAKKWLHRR